MHGLEAYLNHAGPFLLVLFRLSGLMLFAPAISSPIIPARVRLLLVMVFSLAIYPTIPPEQQVPVRMDWMSLGIAVGTETLIGMTIGLLAALPMYAVQMAGLIVGQQMGLGLANVYNPALDIEGDSVGQLLLYVALAAFLALGGIDVVFLATAKTFANIPVGSVLGGTGEAGTMGGSSIAIFSNSVLNLLTGVVMSGFELALRVSAPVLCLIMLETVASAFIMKTMPQLNIMSIGFATKIVVAMLGLILAMGAIAHAVGDDQAIGLSRLIDWATGLRLGGAAVEVSP